MIYTIPFLMKLKRKKKKEPKRVIRKLKYKKSLKNNQKSLIILSFCIKAKDSLPICHFTTI